MCTHTAALAAAEAEADGDAGGDGADVAGGLDGVLLLVLVVLQPATSTAPLQLSAATVRHARLAGRPRPPGLVIISSVMLPMHTPRPPLPPHPEWARLA
jgi:hypothetical protein